MENSGSAIVDFGRFITGFLVVMGIGTSRPIGRGQKPGRGRHAIRIWLMSSNSSTRPAGALGRDTDLVDGHVDRRRSAGIRHDRGFHDVLSGRAGILMEMFRLHTVLI